MWMLLSKRLEEKLGSRQLWMLHLAWTGGTWLSLEFEEEKTLM